MLKTSENRYFNTTCPMCKGKGTFLIDSNENCPMCDGSKKVKLNPENQNLIKYVKRIFYAL